MPAFFANLARGSFLGQSQSISARLLSRRNADPKVARTVRPGRDRHPRADARHAPRCHHADHSLDPEREVFGVPSYPEARQCSFTAHSSRPWSRSCPCTLRNVTVNRSILEVAIEAQHAPGAGLMVPRDWYDAECACADGLADSLNRLRARVSDLEAQLRNVAREDSRRGRKRVGISGKAE